MPHLALLSTSIWGAVAPGKPRDLQAGEAGRALTGQPLRVLCRFNFPAFICYTVAMAMLYREAAESFVVQRAKGGKYHSILGMGISPRLVIPIPL